MTADQSRVPGGSEERPRIWWSPSEAPAQRGVVLAGIRYRIVDGRYVEPADLPADAIELVPVSASPAVVPQSVYVHLVKAGTGAHSHTRTVTDDVNLDYARTEQYFTECSGVEVLDAIAVEVDGRQVWPGSPAVVDPPPAPAIGQDNSPAAAEADLARARHNFKLLNIEYGAALEKITELTGELFRLAAPSGVADLGRAPEQTVCECAKPGCLCLLHDVPAPAVVDRDRLDPHEYLWHLLAEWTGQDRDADRGVVAQEVLRRHDRAEQRALLAEVLAEHAVVDRRHRLDRAARVVVEQWESMGRVYSGSEEFDQLGDQLDDLADALGVPVPDKNEE